MFFTENIFLYIIAKHTLEYVEILSCFLFVMSAPFHETFVVFLGSNTFLNSIQIQKTKSSKNLTLTSIRKLPTTRAAASKLAQARPN